MANQIIRTFHPVGQGAFYSERIDDFNMVYDCGTSTALNPQNKSVTQHFTKKDIINILVISHFDEDHINLIPTLKDTVKEIKMVIYPLMEPEFKACILSTYNDPNLLSIVLNPEEYFGERTKIIWVKPANDDNRQDDDQQLYDIEQLLDQERIESGQILSLPQSADWIFIPYNQKADTRSIVLKREFKAAHIKIDENNIAECISDEAVKNKIHAIYDNITGRINHNSLLLYSGPINKQTHYIEQIFYLNYYYSVPVRQYAGCIYTGDVNMSRDNIRWINSIEQRYDVGTIQIPHHGAAGEFKETLLQNGPYYCPISFGSNNSYKHPAGKVLGSILRTGSYPILVTEVSSCIFILYIKNKG